MSEVKHKYILCPRCELNYIEEHEGYCKVCKAEMGLIDSGILIPDEEELGGEKLCPICKVNYIGEDEDICFLCKREKEAKEAAEKNEEDWDNFEDDEVVAEEEDDTISLDEFAAEEEEDEEDDENENNHAPDDFDISPVDPADFEADEDEEEDDEEDDEGDDL